MSVPFSYLEELRNIALRPFVLQPAFNIRLAREPQSWEERFVKIPDLRQSPHAKIDVIKSAGHASLLCCELIAGQPNKTRGTLQVSIQPANLEDTIFRGVLPSFTTFGFRGNLAKGFVFAQDPPGLKKYIDDLFAIGFTCELLDEPILCGFLWFRVRSDDENRSSGKLE